MTNTNVPQDKRSLILQAATIVLTTRGMQSLSFENVAEQAGLSRQLVRYYFPDMDQLMVALAGHFGNAYRDTLVSGVVQVGQVERLNFFLNFFFDLAAEHPMPDHLEAYDALIAYSVGSTALRTAMCDQYKTLGQVMIHELAIAHPELDGRACEELSFMFVSMMHAHWSFVASLGHSREHGVLARRSIDRLIESYIQDPTPADMEVVPWTRIG